MSQRDQFARYAGFQALQGGVDSGRSPASLGSGALAWAVNATTRDDFITCRPGLTKWPLSFLDANGNTDTAVRDAFTTNGRWQGALGYLADNGTTPIVASVGGRIFLINTTNYTCQDLSTQTGFSMSGVRPQAWMTQVENFVPIQNGEEVPLVFDGATLRESATSALGKGDEVPPGEAMAYVLGRLWVTRPGGRSFIGSDLAYSTDKGRAAAINFTENNYLNGGGEFIVPASAGVIRAMKGVALQDSTTGQGPLQVFTTRGAFSVNAPFDREAWAATQSPIQTVSLLSNGAVAQSATVNVNGDIWFRAPDGIRSFVVARRDHGTWVNTPMSREVTRALRNDSGALLAYASAALFDNRLLTTCAPTIAQASGVTRGITHAGLVALDFAPVSSMFNRSQPVWEGVWTGLRILQIVPVDSAPERLFVFALNTANEVEMWELVTGSRFDVATPNVEGRIEWSFETPEYGFGQGGFTPIPDGTNLRQLAYGDMWLRQLAGTVDIAVKHRPDADPNWQDWATTQVCTADRDCTTATCSTPVSNLAQYRARVRLPAPADDVDPVTGKPYRQGYRFAVRTEVAGYAQIAQMRIVARDQPEDVEGASPDGVCVSTPSLVANACNDDFTYQIT